MITYVLIGVIVIQVIVHYCERRDLYNRIMAENYAEYKRDGTAASEPSAHVKAIKKWRGMGGGDK